MRFKTQAELEQWIAQNRQAPATAKLHAKAERDPIPVDPNLQRRILGVDTALRTTGWGIIEVRGKILKAVDCGLIKNPPNSPVSECLKRLLGGVRELVQLYHPDTAVLEGAFYCRNVRTAMMLGSARGAVIASLAEQGLEIYEYAPRRVKQAVCGFGNASKEQVALLVSQFLHIRTDHFLLDTTDALAMAITHAQELTTTGGFGVPNPL